MKLVTFISDKKERIGALYEKYVIDLREAYAIQLLSQGHSLETALNTACCEIPGSMRCFIDGGERTLKLVRKGFDFVIENPDFGKTKYLLKDVKLRTPIPQPSAIYNMGNAYRPFPIKGFGYKPITCIVGPEESIIIPKEITDFGAVFEIEIGIVIGKKGRRIPNDETAYDYVYGYTVYGDITDYGKQINNEFNSKLHDTFCQIGPCIVTKDEVPDPHNLIKRVYVNGALATERYTKTMIHKVPEFVSIPSQTLTLLPGTIISTGAPTTGRIRPGDVLELEITKIGRIRNPVVTEG